MIHKICGCISLKQQHKGKVFPETLEKRITSTATLARQSEILKH